MVLDDRIPTEATRLARRLESLSEWSQRSLLAARWLEARSPETVAVLFAQLIVNSFGLRDVRSTIAAESMLLASLFGQWSDVHRRHVREAAAAFDELLTLAFLTAEEEPAAPFLDVTEDDLEVPDYGVGRPLTLGERRTVAVRPSRRMIERAMLDPHPLVVSNLLTNAKLIEADVVRMAARRPGATPVLVEIALHPRWRRRRRVAMALVYNPELPPVFGISLLPWLVRGELQAVVADGRLAEEVRDAGRLLLQSVASEDSAQPR